MEMATQGPPCDLVNSAYGPSPTEAEAALPIRHALRTLADDRLWAVIATRPRAHVVVLPTRCALARRRACWRVGVDDAGQLVPAAASVRVVDGRYGRVPAGPQGPRSPGPAWKPRLSASRLAFPRIAQPTSRASRSIPTRRNWRACRSGSARSSGCGATVLGGSPRPDPEASGHRRVSVSAASARRPGRRQTAGGTTNSRRRRLTGDEPPLSSQSQPTAPASARGFSHWPLAPSDRYSRCSSRRRSCTHLEVAWAVRSISRGC